MNLPASLDALHFLRPQWLWALALLPVLAWAWHRRSVHQGAWRGLVDAHLLPHLLEQPSRRPGLHWWPPLLAGLAFVLAVLALAGPSWTRGPEPLWQVRTPLVLALELSGSIEAADLPPSRLAQARARIADLLERRSGGDVGMLVYAGDAYVVSPLTSDPRNVAVFLDALGPDVMPGGDAGGSRADRAIARATELLRQAGYGSGDILLVAGDADAAAAHAAGEAAAAGYRVSVLGLGTAAGAHWRDRDGRIRKAALDAAALRRVADAGGGRLALLSDPRAIELLGVLDPSSRAGRSAGRPAAGAQAQVWKDQGYWLLLPLLLLLPFGFRRGGVFALLACCLLLPGRAAWAAEPDGPWNGSWSGLWQREDQRAHARMEAGARAYRRGDHAGALRAWEGLPGADAAYDRGNALARQGRYPEAIAAYDRALQMRPGMADAIANREAVRKAMREQASQQGQGEQQPRQQAPGQEQAGQEQPGRPRPGEGRQQRADEAQRQRMQQALREGQPREGASGAEAEGPRAEESPRERERRLANEAWLRRVPDDPGGLLRARFELEYRRRLEQGR